MARSKERVLLGAAERVDLPDWGIARLRAKIDTGARTSALHVHGVEAIGEDRVRFTVVLHRDKHDERVTVEARVVRRARVRSSSGKSRERIIVATKLVLGGVEREIEVSLASRRRMIFRMLLGRSALGDDFLVDPSRRYLTKAPLVALATPSKPRKKKKAKKTAGPSKRGLARERS